MNSDPHAVYFGRVGHTRHAPMTHELNYKIAYCLLDLDDLEGADKRSWLFNLGKSWPFGFKPRDHGDGEHDNLAAWVRSTLADEGVTQTASRITLLTLPRMLGYAFNPISVYFIHDEDDRLHHILYQVNNTFGDRHCYLFPVSGDQAVYEHACEKSFHVSPFFPVSGDYTFRIRPPDGEKLSLFIKYTDAEGDKAMTATLDLEARPFSTGSFAKILFGLPLMTLGVTVGIHWEAFKLWLKKARYHSRPEPPEELVENIEN